MIKFFKEDKPEQRRENEELNEKLEKFKKAEKEKKLKWEKEKFEQEREWAHDLLRGSLKEDKLSNMREMEHMEHYYRRLQHAEEFVKQYEIFPHLKPADIEDYKKWLRGFLAKGGNPTHNYNYEMEREGFFKATEDFEIFPFYGSGSLNIIIPQGIKCDGIDKGIGHNNLYFEDGYEVKGDFVPVYKDIKF